MSWVCSLGRDGVVLGRRGSKWKLKSGRGGGWRIECIVYLGIYLYLFGIPRTKLPFSLNSVRALCSGKS